MSRFDASMLGRATKWVREYADTYAWATAGALPTSTLPSAPSPVSIERAPLTPAETAIAIATELCKRFEGFSAHPYLCPAGVPTIGYGNTHYLDGRAVKLTDRPISRDVAEHLLARWLEREVLPGVLRLCPHVREPERLAALLDFTYNLGAGNLAASTLRRRVNAGAWGDVPPQLMRWVYAAGKRLAGLVARRRAEAALV